MRSSRKPPPQSAGRSTPRGADSRASAAEPLPNADAATQVPGAMGVARETELERILRLTRAARIFEGTSEMQRATVAKTLGL